MIRQVDWFTRRFDAEVPAGLYPGLVERLRGTPARLGERLTPWPRKTLTVRVNDKWSIQEHVGHLYDLEELWVKRVAEFVARARELTAADLSNSKTERAGHNHAKIDDLLGRFRSARLGLVERLEAVTPQHLEAASLHPRLKRLMRLPDLAYFIAEHDDHHLAKMAEVAGSVSV